MIPIQPMGYPELASLITLWWELNDHSRLKIIKHAEQLITTQNEKKKEAEPTPKDKLEDGTLHDWSC